MSLSETGMLSVETCPLCGSKKKRLFDRGVYHGHEIANWICQRCGLVFLSPRMDEEEQSKFYATEYREMHHGGARPPTWVLEYEEQRAKHLAQIARENIKQVRAHLDIGCSSGQLLRAVWSEFRCDSVGIEPTDGYRDFCLEQGLLVYRSMEEALASNQERFDLVTMSHVLEHLTDPVGYLMSLREQALCPSGYLVVEVPNLFAHGCFGIWHNFAFSPDTLRETIRKAGFSLSFVKIHGIPRTNRPFFITAIGQPLPPQSQQTPYQVRCSARFVRLRRELGRSGKTPTEFVFDKAVRMAKRVVGKVLRRVGY